MNRKIYDEIEKRFDSKSERYKILFAFEDIYGIFRTSTTVSDSADSLDYELISCHQHTSPAPEDVLKDILYMLRAGEIDLMINDIICIKINGSFSSYRFTGVRDQEMITKNFKKILRFLTIEQRGYIDALHSKNRVLSILDGTTYSVDDLSKKHQSLYCIDKEVFPTSKRADGVITDYSLYTLSNSVIKMSNPYPRPFISIKHALYYYSKYKEKNTNAILLFNRHELEMVNDYDQLKRLAL